MTAIRTALPPAIPTAFPTALPAGTSTWRRPGRSGPVSPGVQVGPILPDLVSSGGVLSSADLHGAESLADAPPRRCQGSDACGRSGVLTIVAEQRTVALCGPHAMNVVFHPEAGPVVPPVVVVDVDG